MCIKTEGVSFQSYLLWNLYEVPLQMNTGIPLSLERHLRNSGFNKIEIQSHREAWHAAMAQMLGVGCGEVQ
jgi:hypothetical protein